jgi:2-dehydro-3-deoxyglucarate aldolase/4-hydroxy-2-oxoheptanedioate aldolase
MVRVPSAQSHHIARALDAGAEGIVVPMLGSAEQAKAVVEAMKFTPRGKRGLAPGLANDRYRMGPVREGLDAANARTQFIALIETVDGIANVDEIAAVDGVDVLWVGHLDLTASMGIPGQFDHPDYIAALDKVLKAGKRNNKGLGRLVADTGEGIALAKQGWDLIIYHGDAWLLQVAIRQGIQTIRQGVGS